jgi:hypothetical protein
MFRLLLFLQISAASAAYTFSFDFFGTYTANSFSSGGSLTDVIFFQKPSSGNSDRQSIQNYLDSTDGTGGNLYTSTPTCVKSGGMALSVIYQTFLASGFYVETGGKSYQNFNSGCFLSRVSVTASAYNGGATGAIGDLMSYFYVELTMNDATSYTVGLSFANLAKYVLENYKQVLYPATASAYSRVQNFNPFFASFSNFGFLTVSPLPPPILSPPPPSPAPPGGYKTPPPFPPPSPPPPGPPPSPPPPNPPPSPPHYLGTYPCNARADFFCSPSVQTSTYLWICPC